MVKKLLILLPSLIQACLCLLPKSGLVLAMSCILVLIQGGLCARMAQPLWFSLLITLLAALPRVEMQSVLILYLLILNLLAYFCIKTIVAIYQK